MTKLLSVLASVGFFFPVCSSFAVTQNLVLEVNGKIFPRDAVPDSCKGILQGAKCDADAYGKYHLEAKKDGELIYNRVTFTGPEGEQVIEQSWEKDGKVKKAIIENRAIGKLSQLEVKDGKAYYQVTDLADKSVKKSVDDAEDNLVVPSTIMAYIKPYSSVIASGEKVQIKVAVLDRRDSFTFNIKKIKDDKSINGEAIQVLEMSPASYIVKAAVDPMYFYVKAKTGEMYAFEGESGLRKKIGSIYKKMKVRSSYEYKNFTPVSTAVSKQECDPTAFLKGKIPMKCEVKQ